MKEAGRRKKRDKGADWVGRCGNKMMKGKPLWQEGQGQGPSSLQSAQAGPIFGDKHPAE